MASSWKNPSTENRGKYNLVPLPDDFEPTEEEEALLGMYKVSKVLKVWQECKSLRCSLQPNFARCDINVQSLRSIERRAARIKEQKAREKLAAKEFEFNQNNAPKRNNRRKKRERSTDDMNNGDQDEDDDSEDDESVDEKSDGASDEHTLQARRAAQLARLRDEVEEKKQAMAKKDSQDEDLRETMLASTEGADLGPLIKKKRLEPKEGTSTLLSGMKIKTPPHEFSEKLELKPWKGKFLLPTSQDEASWSPPASAISPNDGAFLVELDNFDITKAQNGTGNNTIALKFTAPSDSKRFRYAKPGSCFLRVVCSGSVLSSTGLFTIVLSICCSLNIAGPSHDDFNSVLFHFNPRQHERGGHLVVNDKQEGIWGQAISLPLSQIPLIFGQTSVTLIIQINGDGFDIFLEEKHCARLEHRVELPSKPCSLFLQFPSCDDYGSK